MDAVQLDKSLNCEEQGGIHCHGAVRTLIDVPSVLRTLAIIPDGSPK